MGIPHLITHLRPYATSMTIDDHPSLSFSVNTTPNRRVIIDGPGLAYHVYCTYLAEPRSVAHPLTIASLHEQIGPAVIAWLDQLERCGIKMYGLKENPPRDSNRKLIRDLFVVIESISMASYH